jgi:hypothetical protein
MRALMAVTALCAALWAASAPAEAATRTCTWGGTPLAPTGSTTNSPGITNTPSSGPLEFHATGRLAGDCRGRLIFDGVMDTGTTCGAISFHGVTRGLPGVARFAGVSVAGVAPARLYDRAGNIVGSENAQFLTGAAFSACLTPAGLRGTPFSSVIELL